MKRKKPYLFAAVGMALVLSILLSACAIIRIVKRPAGQPTAEESETLPPPVIPTVDYLPTAEDAYSSRFDPPSYDGMTALPAGKIGEDGYYWLSTLEKSEERAAYKALLSMSEAFDKKAVFSEKITSDRLEKVTKLFLLDHPEVFFYKSTYEWCEQNGSIRWSTFTFNAPREEILRRRGEIDGVCRHILSLIPEGAGDVQAEMIIARWLASNVTYDASAPNAYTLYGALIDRRCVCEGYAEAFQYLCHLVGIPCFSISGEAFNGEKYESHKWNGVKIGGDWYLCDITFASSGKESFVRCFNGSEFLADDHIAEDAIKDGLPPFTARRAGYFELYGLFINASADDEALLSAMEHYYYEYKAEADEPYVSVILLADSEEAADAWKERMNAGECKLIRNLVKTFLKRHGKTDSGCSYAWTNGRMLSFVFEE